ncbi:zf-HC2 domain-containing protein [Paenibacillus sp. GSMTC-2017]|uniref:anti-sigma factor n=1 Tax=Paenibacillus sp. GSMTC-2017 TaxID=2794350 RepID=UPI0018D6D2E1|nr:zf-HC2 domain-containing protein [Paenibacillus sp. GSMTC-2017]MBH5318163.1 zf-HC2 domain-containing protein [Paenibacillus sp. GSMTC-2017]
MNCQEVMELMHRQIDNDLNESEREVLMAHTRHCPDCAAMFERLKLLSADLTCLPKVVPSYSLVDAILPQLEQIELLSQKSNAIVETTRIDQTAIPTQPRRLKRNRRIPSWGALGGIIAAGVVAGLFLVTYPPDLSKNDQMSESQYSAEMKNNAITGDSSALKSRAVDPGGDVVEVPSAFITGNNIDFNVQDQSKNLEPLSVEDQSGDESVKVEQEARISVTSKDNSVEGSSEPQNKPPTDFGIASAEGLTSPDGQFVATVNGHTIAVVIASNGEVAMETSRKNGQHQQLVWSEDGSELTYEVHLDRGAIEKYTITTSDWKEKKATR